MNKYLDSGNEARIKKAYESRDPRLQMAVITPYAQYNGASSGIAHTYTLRWPYRGSDSAEPFDIRTVQTISFTIYGESLYLKVWNRQNVILMDW